MKRFVSAFVCALFLFSTLAFAWHIKLVHAEQRTWLVDDDRPADFHSIQEAINHANDGDAILVRSGTYYENLIVNKTLTLIGKNTETTIIDGKGKTVVSIKANDVRLAGFTIRNGKSNIWARGVSGIKIAGNIVNASIGEGTSYAGIYLDMVRDSIIEHNVISDNVENGLTLGRRSNNNTISNNRICQNGGSGIYLAQLRDNRNIIAHNNVSCNHDYGIQMAGVHNNTILGNNIESNGVGLLVVGAENIVRENYIASSVEAGIRLIELPYPFYTFDNKFYHNNIENTVQVRIMGHDSCPQLNPNYWDNGYPSGGNYWSDYTGIDVNNDGIGDTPYVIGGNNVDKYPLMNRWTPPSQVVTATVDICPQTLNLRSEGRWITARIELPEGYKLKDINVSSVMLNNTVPSEMHPKRTKDCTSSHKQALIVKFDREEVIQYILSTVTARKRFMTVTLTLTSKLNDGTPFQGSDTIKITTYSYHHNHDQVFHHDNHNHHHRLCPYA